MKFLVDAQLPVRLARLLQEQGHDALHTRDLPEQNSTSDSAINEISVREERIVITKDTDFVESFLVSQQPYKLLLISTGNIKNSALEELFLKNLARLTELFASHTYIEMSREAIVVHD